MTVADHLQRAHLLLECAGRISSDGFVVDRVLSLLPKLQQPLDSSMFFQAHKGSRGGFYGRLRNSEILGKLGAFRFWVHDVHSPKLTWNLKRSGFKRTAVYQGTPLKVPCVFGRPGSEASTEYFAQTLLRLPYIETQSPHYIYYLGSVLRGLETDFKGSFEGEIRL